MVRFPRGWTHDWNLGPTGARGWIYCDKHVTTDARQILVTEVAAGSPADGKLKVGDVITGVTGKPIDDDARMLFGKAITAAESEEKGGRLPLTIWREGKTFEIIIELPILGSYSDTAPYDCVKSQRIFEQGCERLAEKMRANPRAGNEITRALNALALLASGDKKVSARRKRAGGFTLRIQPIKRSSHLAIRLCEYPARRICDRHGRSQLC